MKIAAITIDVLLLGITKTPYPFNCSDVVIETEEPSALACFTVHGDGVESMRISHINILNYETIISRSGDKYKCWKPEANQQLTDSATQGFQQEGETRSCGYGRSSHAGK